MLVEQEIVDVSKPPVKYKQYVHQPLVYLVPGFALGILSEYVFSGFVGMTFVATLVSFLAALFWAHRRWGVFLLILCLALSGRLYAQSRYVFSLNHIEHVAKYHRMTPMELRGVIVSDVETRKFFNGVKVSFTLKVHEYKSPWGWKDKEGEVLVNLFRKEPLFYGDQIEVTGKLHRPYNFSEDSTFSYEKYLRRRGISRILSVKNNQEVIVLEQRSGNAFQYAMLCVRQRLKDTFTQHLTENEAGLMKAMVLGERSHIPRHIRELFVLTGTAHILAISGLHVGIVAAVFLAFLKLFPIGRKAQLLSVVILLFLYVTLTAGRPSVLRAAIMSSVILLGFALERESDSLNSLMLAALIILLINPFYLFDIGFQLSFVCVLSILKITPIISGVLTRFGIMPSGKDYPKQKFRWYIIQSLTVSSAIWIGSLGVIVYYFNVLTPVSILANLFVIPLIAVIIVCGAGLLLSSLLIPAIAVTWAMCLKITLNLLGGIVFLLHKIPGAYVTNVVVTPWGLVIYYGIVLAVCFGIPWIIVCIKK